MNIVLAFVFSVSALVLAGGPAMAQKKLPTCDRLCAGYCQKRVAAGTSVGYSLCYRECRRINSDPTRNRCTQ